MYCVYCVNVLCIIFRVACLFSPRLSLLWVAIWIMQSSSLILFMTGWCLDWIWNGKCASEYFGFDLKNPLYVLHTPYKTPKMDTCSPCVLRVWLCIAWVSCLPMTLKQVTTLPWHITPKGTLYGPMYRIYMG